MFFFDIMAIPQNSNIDFPQKKIDLKLFISKYIFVNSLLKNVFKKLVLKFVVRFVRRNADIKKIIIVFSLYAFDQI